MVYRYGSRADWGDIFGLKAEDLTIAQLKKLKIEKLIEFATTDPRVEQIIGDCIAYTVEHKDVTVLNKLTDEEFKGLSYLKAKYNECISLNSDALSVLSDSYYEPSRSDYVWWKRLSNENKAQEFARWINGKQSIINPCKIDYLWLEEKHPWLVDPVIKKVIEGSQDSIIEMIPQLSEIRMLQYIDKIFECDKFTYAHSLSNKHTPRRYVIKALRAIAGKKIVPNIRVSLGKSILRELPPVMRLKVLESLLLHMRDGTVAFDDIDTKEDLGVLLFGTAIKYNDRVQLVVKRFQHLYT